MKLVEVSVKQPISITVAVLFTFLAGLVAVRMVAVEMTPEVEDTIVAVTTFWENASPQEIESEVVDPQEEKLQGLSNLRSITSDSSQGQGQIRLEFNAGIDKNIALRDVSDKLREVPAYPFGVDEPVIEASDPESQDYIAWYILQCDDPEFDVRELQTFSEDKLKPILERISGISEVNALGGVEREVQIEVDSEKLAQYGITLTQFTQKLQASNTNSSAGALPLGKLDIRLRAVGRFDSPESVRELVLRHDTKSGPVKVGDVATVKEGFKEATAFVRASGKRSIAFNFQREPGSNVLEIMSLLRAKVDEFNQPGNVLDTEAKRLGLNGALHMRLSYDATRYVSQALDQVQNNIYIGGALAIVVLLLFLRSLRSLGIIAISIPVSMVGAIILMVAMGRTVNVISLAGIAFAVGMVVDNSIVVLENIYRHLEMGKRKLQAAVDGTSEVAGAVLASSLTTLIVFIPILLITDQVGQLFRDISLAIMTAVAFSYIVAVTVIPAAGAKILNHKRYEGQSDELDKENIYALFLKSILRSNLLRLAVVVFMSVGSIVGAYYLMPPMDYLPKGNRNITFGLVLTPPGLNLSQLEEMGSRVEDQVRPYWEDQPNRPALRDMYTGREVYPTALSEYFMVSRNGIMFHGGISSDDKHAVDNVTLLQHATRPEILPGVFSFAFQFPLFRLGGTTGSAVKINLVGQDLDRVSASAGALIGTLMQQYGPGAVRPDPSNFNLKVQEVQLRINEEAMARAGLTRRDLVLAMQAAGDGIFIGEYEFQGDLVDLKIWSHQSQQANAITKIEDTPVTLPDGRIMRLGQLSEIIWTDAAERIKRVGRQRAVTLEFTAPQGMPLEQVVGDLNAVIDQLRQTGAITNDVNTDIQGSAGKLLQIRNALLGDGTVMGFVSSSMFTSFVAVYLLMCILFQSWLKPLVIMFTVPLATFGGFLGLSLVHMWSLSDPYMPIQNLDVLTLLGFVILSGVVVNNAILIVAQADVLLKQGEHDRITAITKASQSRVRPIFMSLLTSVGGMLPLILNPGAGSELYRGLGAVVVGGMLLSTFFTLILIPVLLTYIEKVRDVANLVKPAAISMLFLVMTGCQSFYPSTKVELDSKDLPETYKGLGLQSSIEMAWWNQFEDPVIEELISKAMNEELSLKVLQKRIESVIALSRKINAENYPSLDLRSSATREKIPSFGISERTNLTAALGLNYTLDWLGRVQDEQKISNAEVAIAKERSNAHKLRLVHLILNHYLKYRLAQNHDAQLEIELIKQKDLLKLSKELFKYGKVTQESVHQSQMALHQIEIEKSRLYFQKEVERLALERWTGTVEGELTQILKEKQTLPKLPELDIGTPNDLLVQRSDIRIASQQVLAKAASLDLSKKEIYPKLTLGAELSFYGESLGNWINSNNSGHSYGPRLSWRLFEFGRLKQERKSAMANYDEAVLNWRVVVREALLKVSQLVQRFQQQKHQLQLEYKIQNQHEEIVQQKQALYRHGRVSQVEVLQAELQQLQHRRNLAQTRLSKTLVQIDLYKNLGLDLQKDHSPKPQMIEREVSEKVLDVYLEKPKN